MTNEQILASFDKTGLAVVQILIVLFSIFSVVLALVFSVLVTAFILIWQIARLVLVLILTHRQTRAAFALVGGR